MYIVLIDDYGSHESMHVQPEDVLKVQDLFAPCAGCGKAVLAKDINEDGECSRCVEAEEVATSA